MVRITARGTPPSSPAATRSPKGGVPHFPRPSRLDAPLELPGEKAEKAGAGWG
jgi:hypothetical protein